MNNKSRWWVYILIFFATQIIAGLLGAIGGGVSRRGYDAITTEWVLSLALFLANTLAILLYLRLRPAEVTRQSTLQGVQGRNRPRTKLMFLLALPVIVLVNLVQELCFPEIPDLVGEETFKAIMYNPIGLLTIAAIGPVCEEVLFRGGVQHCLHKSFPEQGPQMAIGLSAVIFALIHLNPAQMPAAFVLGLLLGAAYWWTKSLIAPALIHVFNNSFACMMSIISPDSDSFVEFVGGKEGAVLMCAVSLLVLVAVAYAIRHEAGKED